MTRWLTKSAMRPGILEGRSIPISRGAECCKNPSRKSSRRSGMPNFGRRHRRLLMADTQISPAASVLRANPHLLNRLRHPSAPLTNGQSNANSGAMSESRSESAFLSESR